MKTKKKILVFIDWFLPGYKAGGPIQSCANLIEHLKDEFEFSVITRNTDYCETQPYSNVKSDEWSTLENGTRVYYFSKKNLKQRNIRKLLDTEEYQYVYLNGIFSLFFTLIPLFILRNSKNKKVVVAARGMFASSALNVKKTKKQYFLFMARKLGLFENVIFHATTNIEAVDIQLTMGMDSKIIVASNLPSKRTACELQPRIKKVGELRLVNMARIAPEKNLHYALETLYKVKGKIFLDIYGTIYDQTYWQKCQALIKDLPSNICVTYKKSIDNKKVIETLSQYHVMLMPTQGENFGHIILESLTAGTPVIISDQTVWKSLREKDIGWDLSLKQSMEFSLAISQCVAWNQEEYNARSKNAYEYAKVFINDSTHANENRKLFQPFVKPNTEI